MPEPEKSEHAKNVEELMKEDRELSADEARVEMEKKLNEMSRQSIPAEEPLLQFFAYAHLPEHLRNASRPFCELAQQVIKEWPRNAERTVTLRKLLEAKDAAVRSKLSGS